MNNNNNKKVIIKISENIFNTLSYDELKTKIANLN